MSRPSPVEVTARDLAAAGRSRVSRRRTDNGRPRPRMERPHAVGSIPDSRLYGSSGPSGRPLLQGRDHTQVVIQTGAPWIRGLPGTTGDNGGLNRGHIRGQVSGTGIG